MKINPTTIPCVILALFASSASITATPIVLDFEGFPTTSNPSPGSLIPEANRLSAQYLTTLGITFSSAAPYVGVVNLGSGTTSGNMALSGATPEGAVTYSGVSFTAEFFDPAHPATPAVTDFFSVRGDLVADGSGGTLRAFDIFGHLIGQQFINNVGGDTFTISSPGIHRVTFTGSGTIGLDDVSFNAVTPVADMETVQAVIHPAVELVWPSVAGQTYQVQSTPTLVPAAWTNFGGPVQGDGTDKSVFDTTRNRVKQFYRVLKLP